MRVPLWLCLMVTGLLCYLATQTPVSGQGVSEQRVKAAVEKGVKHLTDVQNADGTWRHGNNSNGATTLAAWTLLECGVPANDDRIKRAANTTRDYILTSTQTYCIALAIMFFDKLGDPRDIPLIEVLALQLLAGQQGVYGWTYNCPELPAVLLKPRQDLVAKTKADGPTKLPKVKTPRPPTDVDKKIWDWAMSLYANGFFAPMRVPTPMEAKADGLTDNSNTQFAMLALWVAKRYGMPVERALVGTELRFRASQTKIGGWAYKQGAEASTQMTACGLISLALGNACSLPKMKKADLTKDKQVNDALSVIYASIGELGQAREQLAQSITPESYYYLWTMERMAVIYGFEKIGDKDWYRWGVDLLLTLQTEKGDWERGETVHDTCFALLFLKKVNVAADLSKDMKGKVKDPPKPSADLLKQIIIEVKPGIDLPKSKDPKKNSPQPEECPMPPASIPQELTQGALCGHSGPRVALLRQLRRD